MVEIGCIALGTATIAGLVLGRFMTRNWIYRSAAKRDKQRNDKKHRSM